MRALRDRGGVRTAHPQADTYRIRCRFALLVCALVTLTDEVVTGGRAVADATPVVRWWNTDGDADADSPL